MSDPSLSPPRSHSPARVTRRAPILLAVVAVLVVGGLVDRTAGHSNTATANAAVPPVPVAAPADAISSSWFCAGAGQSSTGGEGGEVVIANAGASPVQANVTVVSTSGASQKSTLTVGARSNAGVAETVTGADRWSGAIVDADSGAVAVAQVLDGPFGRSSQPCASSGSTNWYFPSGQTRINADETILLLNPYPTDSIVDMSFSTNQGIEQPQGFQSIDVPPGGLVAADLGTEMRRRTTIAATVTARVGSVVAWEAFGASAPKQGEPLVGSAAGNASLADPALPVAGTDVSLGAASTSTSWVWPDGLAGPGVDEQYVIYNPGSETAELRLSVGLAQGSAEPFELSVGPYEVVPIVSEQQARIPAGVPHSASLLSTNGVPVVATRAVTAQNGSDTGGAITGIGSMNGEQMAALEWVIPAPATDSSHRGDIVIYNQSNQAVRATVAGASGAPVGEPVSVPAEGRAQVEVPAGTGEPVIVKATASVYVEYDLFGVGTTTGVSLSSGVPLT